MGASEEVAGGVDAFFNKYIHHSDWLPLIDRLLERKQITFVRHAESQLNLWMQSPDNFVAQYPKNAALYDPALTVTGF